jgi:hypothetical protein
MRQSINQSNPPLRLWHRGLIAAAVKNVLHDAPMDGSPGNHFQYSAASLCAIDQANIEIQRRITTFDDNIWDSFHAIFGRLDSLLTKMDTVVNENTVLRAAYDASKQESAALKATVDTLSRNIDEQIAIPAPPSPHLTASSPTMEEMTMQLSVVQHDIQHVLEAVRNPPGKRKRCTSNEDDEPTTPRNRQPATNRRRDASSEHSMMHSKHATSASQDALDALMIKYPTRPLVITSTEATTDPLPDSPAAQDTALPDAPTTTAPAENDGWKTVERKATQKKRRNDKADNKRAATTANNTPTTKNGGRGKNTHQPRTNTPSAKKTWAEVIKSAGIDVQIVLGNGNFGLTTRTKMRGERRGRAALSRITNDMLLGAIAASTGLWVIGITVTVSYLVIMA